MRKLVFIALLVSFTITSCASRKSHCPAYGDVDVEETNKNLV